jgi:serine/threonine-protein kinase RsbW
MAQSANLSDTEFELDGNLEELGRLWECVDQFCQAQGLDTETTFDLILVLEELFTNAVRHGGCGGMTNAVHVHLRLLENGGMAVEYRDRGVPFDPTSAPEPDLAAPLSERQHGGLGIHLVRQMMRDLEYRRTGEWNQLIMRREGKHEAKSI